MVARASALSIPELLEKLISSLFGGGLFLVAFALFAQYCSIASLVVSLCSSPTLILISCSLYAIACVICVLLFSVCIGVRYPDIPAPYLLMT